MGQLVSALFQKPAPITPERKQELIASGCSVEPRQPMFGDFHQEQFRWMRRDPAGKLLEDFTCFNEEEAWLQLDRAHTLASRQFTVTIEGFYAEAIVETVGPQYFAPEHGFAARDRSDIDRLHVGDNIVFRNGRASFTALRTR